VVECYERKQAIIPQQALALINSEPGAQHGRLLARSLSAQVKEGRGVRDGGVRAGADPHADDRGVGGVHRVPQATGAGVSEDETGSRGKDVDGRLPSSDPVVRARENLIHVLLNHHEFVTIR